MKYRPLGAWILLKEVQPEKKTTASGIILAKDDSENDRTAIGVIIKLGNGVALGNGTRTQFTVNEGATVRYRKYAGIELEIENEKFYQLYESDILGVIDDDIPSVSNILNAENQN